MVKTHPGRWHPARDCGRAGVRACEGRARTGGFCKDLRVIEVIEVLQTSTHERKKRIALLAASPKIGDQKISAYAKTADCNPKLALISASHDHTNRHLNFMSE
jgi:hypothetical protein